MSERSYQVQISGRDRLGRRLGVATLLLVSLVALEGLAAPADWVQMNEDGFFGYSPTSTPTELFVFGPDLYAYDDHGLYRMRLDPCLEWEQLNVPVLPGSWTFQPAGSVLYLSCGKELWRLNQGDPFTGWKKATLSGPPAGASIVPMTLFDGQIYAVVYPSTTDTFEIWRTPDLGKNSMTWTKVVSDGFGDPQNHALGFLTVYNNRLIAVTTMTRSSMFGDPSGFGSGIEVWESATGNSGTWAQVNEDGFGTETTPVGSSKPFRTNQDVGSCAVYKGHLYIGTMSHYGAEVWRYDGTGLAGWKDVTPLWAGVSIFSGPGRNNAMAVHKSDLYLAEGFPTGNLARYDGTSWNVVVSGPNPFDPSNGGFGSLAVLDGKLYASTLHSPYLGGKVRGDQVWGYPYSQKPPVCIERQAPDLLYDPPLIRWVVPDHLIELTFVLKNDGPTPIEGDYLLGFAIDGRLVHVEPGPTLGPGESAELAFSYDVGDGEHSMDLIADLENQVEEGNEENNEHSFVFMVGESGRRPGPDLEQGGLENLVPGLENLERGPKPDPALLVEAEAEPLCRRGSTHEVHVRWSAGEEPFERLELELAHPDRTFEPIELELPEGETTIGMNLPEGGEVEVILRASNPEGEYSTSTMVDLPPC